MHVHLYESVDVYTDMRLSWIPYYKFDTQMHGHHYESVDVHTDVRLCWIPCYIFDIKMHVHLNELVDADTELKPCWISCYMFDIQCLTFLWISWSSYRACFAEICLHLFMKVCYTKQRLSLWCSWWLYRGEYSLNSSLFM